MIFTKLKLKKFNKYIYLLLKKSNKNENFFKNNTFIYFDNKK